MNNNTAILNQNGWLTQAMDMEALWTHDELEPQVLDIKFKLKQPHAQLRNGGHSGGFFMGKVMLDDEDTRYDAASDIIVKLRQRGVHYPIQRVIGPATGATKLAQTCAELITDFQGQHCDWASPVKVGDGKDRTMVFDDEEHVPQKGETVLLVEDTLTTGSSVQLAVQACADYDINVLPFIGMLMNRSGRSMVDGYNLVSLISKTLPVWEPKDCPYCKRGSKAISPKEGKNWKILKKAA